MEDSGGNKTNPIQDSMEWQECWLLSRHKTEKHYIEDSTRGKSNIDIFKWHFLLNKRCVNKQRKRQKTLFM